MIKTKIKLIRLSFLTKYFIAVLVHFIPKSSPYFDKAEQKCIWRLFHKEIF